jgi:hypothetical protein
LNKEGEKLFSALEAQKLFTPKPDNPNPLLRSTSVLQLGGIDIAHGRTQKFRATPLLQGAPENHQTLLNGKSYFSK